MTGRKRGSDPAAAAFGALSRAEFQELVRAPYGVAKERINNPFDLLMQSLVIMITQHQEKIRDPVADEDFLIAEAIDLADKILQKIDAWGLLK